MISPEAVAILELLASRASMRAPDAPPPTLAERRAQSSATFALVDPFAIEPTAVTTLAGQPALRIGKGTGPTIFHLHGGGYVMGGLDTHAGLAARLAASVDGRAVLLDYGLAPESPFPRAFDDAAAAYRELVDEVGPDRLVVTGDSAGGGLAVAALAASRAAGIAMPAALALLSPWVDLTLSDVSIPSLAAHDGVLSPELLDQWSAMYAAGAERTDPRLSPLLGELSGLPPTLVQVGGAEVLRSDAERLVASLVASGVDATLTVFEGLFHCFQLFPALPESERAIRAIAAHINASVGS